MSEKNPQSRKSLQIGGFVPFTTVDYPNHLSAVIFCQGCPWRCRYCHNPHLQKFVRSTVSWKSVLSELTKRRNFLEAVVFSGGEPTAQHSLPEAIQAVRALGYQIGLHTAGTFPDVFQSVLPIVDWVGFDVKAPLDARYDRITGQANSFSAATVSLKALLASGIPYELRTTVHPALLSPVDLEEISTTIQDLGATPTKLQAFRSDGCTDFALSVSSVPVGSA